MRLPLPWLSAFLVSIGLHGPLSAQSPHYRTGPVPGWVTVLELEGRGVTDTNCLQGGEEVLLLDRQYDLASRTVYWRRVVRLTSAEGVQNGSRIELDIDPAYEQLTFHQLTVVRNGKAMDRMDPGQIRVLHREQDMSSYLYDGSLSIVIDLKDVRVGDVIDYAITITGWNPADEGRYHRALYMAYSAPVARVHTRFIVPPGRTPTFRDTHLDERPQVRTTARGTETVWDMGPMPCVQPDDGAPGWYDPYPLLEVSEFTSVDDLRAWALRQFDTDRGISGELARRVAGIKALTDTEARIDSAVHLVQREVRYLGLEDGISAYRPHPPAQVFEQRFGDCKDKALLLATVLQAVGVPAYPALVNTSSGLRLDAHLPRPGLFDHCITIIPRAADTLWVDPTYTHNQGSGHDRYTPDYGLALVVAPGFAGYTRMQVNDTGTVDVVERIVLDTLGGGGDLVVTSTYGGRKADATRADLASASIQEVSTRYAEFYADLYGPCDMVEDLRIADDPVANRITITEHYHIRQAWDTAAAGDGLVFATIAHTVRDHQAKPGTADRTAPFALGEPFRVRHRIELRMPSDWELETGSMELEGHGIRYRRTIGKDSGRDLWFDYTYSSDRRSVEASEARALQDLQEKVTEGLSWEFTQHFDEPGGQRSGVWGKWLYILFCAGLGLFGALRLYRWDPVPHPETFGHQAWSIGSYLILPAIGVSIAPLQILWNMLSDGGAFFNATDLTDVVATEHPVLVDLYMHGSQFVGFVQLAFSVVLIILFYQRRSSVPLLMKVLYAGTLTWLCIDFWCYETLGFESITGEAYGAKDLTRAFIAAAIWVPVFHFSERVRFTFTRRLDPVNEAAQMPTPPPGHPPVA